MVCKSIFMLALFIAPLVIIISFSITSLTLLFALYILSGFGMAGMGMCKRKNYHKGVSATS